jgi:hypothetical protein
MDLIGLNTAAMAGKIYFGKRQRWTKGNSGPATMQFSSRNLKR